jgi:hypothetical protein
MKTERDKEEKNKRVVCIEQKQRQQRQRGSLAMIYEMKLLIRKIIEEQKRDLACVLFVTLILFLLLLKFYRDNWLN